MDLLPSTPLDLHNLADAPGLPCMQVQLTTFACGAMEIAVKLAHPLADAQTLIRFVHDWAIINRALLGTARITADLPSRPFDPPSLDRAAAGDIDAPQPDSEFMSIARCLPTHRYDWWASEDGCPSSMKPATQIPSEIDPTTVGALGRPLPWSEWDVMAPVSHYLVYFNSEEVHSIWEDASSSGRISHLDSLLAHIWMVLNRARGLHGDQTVHLDYTFGVRGRLSPPLPESFIGSPIMLAAVTSTGKESSIGRLATKICSTLSLFNSNTIPAVLHELAYEISPQRRWNAFLGERHAIVTSWIRLDAYGVDFGTGVAPRYVEPIIPSCDGCIQVMEVGLGAEAAKEGMKEWWDGVVCVSLHLNADQCDGEVLGG